MKPNRVFLLALAPLLLVLGAAGLFAGSLVPYGLPQGSDEEYPAAAMYREKYGTEEPRDAIMSDDATWNAFLAFQYSMAEMMTQPEALQENRRYVHDTQEQSMQPGAMVQTSMGHMYWNKQMTMINSPLADGSGDHATPTIIIGDDIGLEGKNLYFPSQDVLAQMAQLFAQQAALGEEADNDRVTPAEFVSRRDALEEQLLQLMAQEIANVRELAKDQDIYALGFRRGPSGQRPLQLDPATLSNNLEGLGVTVPEETEGGDSGVGLSSAEPIVEPVQNEQDAAELESDYTRFTAPADVENETERAQREADLGLFRFRVLPRDVAGGVKSNDPILTPEYQPGGGLNLPSTERED